MLQRSRSSSEIKLTPVQVAALMLLGLVLLHAMDILVSGYSIFSKSLTIAGMVVLLTFAVRWRRFTNRSTIGVLFVIAAMTGFLAWYPAYYWGTIATIRPALGLTGLLYIAAPFIVIFMQRGYSFEMSCFGAGLSTVVLVVPIIQYFGPNFHQPAFHLIYGGTRALPNSVPTILPYSRFSHFYSWNPRGYFEQSATRPPSPWVAWTLCASTNEGTSADFDHLDDSSQTIRITVDQNPVGKPWYAIWTSSHWPVRGSEPCHVHFRARADEPRKVMVGVAKQNSGESVTRVEFELTTEWQDYHLNFTPTSNVNLVEVSFYLHPSIVPIELKELEFTSAGRETKPHLPMTPYTMTSLCNDRGFRDRDYAVPRPENTFRIVCVGDSCTWGQGVKSEDAFPKVLERLLQESSTAGESKPTFEVINTGRCGYSSQHERLCFEQEASKYQPQLVVLQMLDNDNEWPGMTITGDKLNDYSLCLEEVKKLDDYCSARKMKLVVLLFRYLRMTKRWQSLHDTLVQGLSGRNVSIVESGSALDARLARSKGFLKDQSIVHPLDAHPNEIAHEIAGQALFEALKRERLIPDR